MNVFELIVTFHHFVQLTDPSILRTTRYVSVVLESFSRHCCPHITKWCMFRLGASIRIVCILSVLTLETQTFSNLNLNFSIEAFLDEVSLS